MIFQIFALLLRQDYKQIQTIIYIEDYVNMSAHVLLNLLNNLRKRDTMRGLPSILSLFCDEFNKFNKQEPEC